LNVKHAFVNGDEKNLAGLTSHGTKTGNKSRMFLQTGEWEPSVRSRTEKAANAGALLVNNGFDMGNGLDEAYHNYRNTVTNIKAREHVGTTFARSIGSRHAVGSAAID